MKLIVKYTAIDPLYSDQTQCFIGSTCEECWDQKYAFEEWLGRDHPCGINCIYQTELVNYNENEY